MRSEKVLAIYENVGYNKLLCAPGKIQKSFQRIREYQKSADCGGEAISAAMLLFNVWGRKTGQIREMRFDINSRGMRKDGQKVAEDA